MADEQRFDSTSPTHGPGATDIVPAARTEGLNMEAVGDELVVFDCGTFQYHHLNASAAAIWTLCDGTRSCADIAASGTARGFPLDHDMVALAVAEFGKLGLLESVPIAVDSRIERRIVLRRMAAGLAGAATLPVIASITAPEAGAAGCSPCPTCCNQTTGACLTPRSNFQSCQKTCQCPSGTCCGLYTGTCNQIAYQLNLCK